MVLVFEILAINDPSAGLTNRGVGRRCLSIYPFLPGVVSRSFGNENGLGRCRLRGWM